MSIIASATDRSIISLENAQDYIKVEKGQPAIEKILFEWIDWISGLVESYCGKVIKSQEVEWITNGNGCEFLILEQYPIIALQGETEAARLANLQYRNTDGTGTWTDLLTDEDLIDFNQNWMVMLLGGNVFPSGLRNIRIKYVSGWSDPPSDIKKVVCEMLAVMWNESKQGQAIIGFQNLSDSMAGGSKGSSIMDLSDRHKAILDRYRRLV